MWMTGKTFLCGALISIFLTSGCAVGYGIGHTSHSASTASSPSSILLGDQPLKFSATYQEFRIIDSTGLLLAAFVNGGRQYNARQEAIDQAKYKTPNKDGTVTVEYSYKPMPILAGLLTDFRLRLPLGDVSVENPTGTEITPTSAGYWGFDLRPEFYTFHPIKSLPLLGSLWLNVVVENWKADRPDGESIDLFEIDMNFGTSLSYIIMPQLTATGRFGIGLLAPIFGALDGGDKLAINGELEVGYAPFFTDKFGFQVSGVAQFGKAHATERSATYNRFGINATVMFGNQNKNRGKKTDSTPTPPTTAPETPAVGANLSGNICVGNSVPAECKIVDRLPEGEKLIYVLCAQQTQDAATKSDFSTQPKVCRQAAGALHKVATGSTTLPPEQRRDVYIAAATAYDFSAAGYELTANKLGEDHCAMVEGVFAMVVGPDPSKPNIPTKVAWAEASVNQCRAQWNCTTQDTSQGASIVCASKSVPVTPDPAATPPTTPAPTTKP